MRGTLEKLLARSNSGEAVLNLLATLGCEELRRGRDGNLLSVKTERLGRRDAPGRCVRLIEQPRFVQGCHDVPDRRGAHTVLIAELARQGLRGHRFPRG